MCPDVNVNFLKSIRRTTFWVNNLSTAGVRVWVISDPGRALRQNINRWTTLRNKCLRQTFSTMLDHLCLFFSDKCVLLIIDPQLVGYTHKIDLLLPQIFSFPGKKMYLLSTTWTSLWVYRLFVKTTKFKCAAILEKDSWLSHYYGSHWYSSQDPPYSGPDGFFSLYLTNLIPPKLIQPKQWGQPVTCSSFDWEKEKDSESLCAHLKFLSRLLSLNAL